jgi:hypothetical protein
MTFSRAQARWTIGVVSMSILALAACGAPAPAAANGETTARTADASASASVGAADATATSSIVGRWMQVHTCDQLVAGLQQAGLGEIAPTVIGDYFPDASIEELAAKPDPCSGAKPQRHAHFFTDAGAFGSIDQHGEQVDDGTWSVDGDVLTIGEGHWRFEIDAGSLSLEPLISKQQTRDALADPTEWSTAGWIVAVAYPGSTWKRVPCDGWC